MKKLWHNFWFKAIDVRQYALLRIAFGYLSAVYLVQLLPYTTEHVSSAGWLKDIKLTSVLNWGSWSLFNLNLGNHANVYALTILLIGVCAAVMMLLGWKTRLATVITWLVLVSLWNRNPLLLDGDDAVLKVMAFYLMFSPCGEAWSLDAINKVNTQQVAVWPLRLIQFQIALIYLVSGWVKFHSSSWLDGTILQYVLSHPHYSRFDLSYFFENSYCIALMAGLAFLIRWWELLFPLLLLNRYLRWISISLGIAFHLGLLIFMNLRWFPLIMLALYPALLSTTEFMQLIKAARVTLKRCQHND